MRGHIEALARRLKQAGDPRTMDQLRADIFMDLLLGKGAGQGAGGGVITMTADLETLADLADRAADIPGLGPLIADVARQTLEENSNAEFRYKITAGNGDVIIGTPSRFASKALRRFLETRDETCVAPGCRMSATECDIDHRTPYAFGGLTTDRDNQPLCRHDHMVKDSGGWKLFRNTEGAYTWVSRLGHVYTTGRSP